MQEIRNNCHENVTLNWIRFSIFWALLSSLYKVDRCLYELFGSADSYLTIFPAENQNIEKFPEEPSNKMRYILNKYFDPF